MFKDIDDAIKHERKMVKEYKETADSWYAGGCSFAQAEGNVCLECAAEHEQLASWLEELKQRREADRWIPVSERLPEDYTKVLITNGYGTVTRVVWNTWYQNEYKDARKEYKAIAWKPLPKPYESEAENEGIHNQ